MEMSPSLAAAEPQPADLQRDLAASYWRLAMMVEQTRQGDALEWWRKAYEEPSSMKQQFGIMLPTGEPCLAQLREKVSP
jgi:hypothetical protein